MVEFGDKDFKEEKDFVIDDSCGDIILIDQFCKFLLFVYTKCLLKFFLDFFAPYIISKFWTNFVKKLENQNFRTEKLFAKLNFGRKNFLTKKNPKVLPSENILVHNVNQNLFYLNCVLNILWLKRIKHNNDFRIEENIVKKKFQTECS